MRKKTKLVTLIIILAIAVIVAVVWWWKSVPSLSNFTIKKETARMEKFAEKGGIVAGWLRVEGTNIDLPLLIASTDDNFLNDEDNYAWTLDVTDENSNRPTFLSHNIRNVSKNPLLGDDTMMYFEQLMSFIYPSFLQENQYIEYTNIDGKTELYRIYGVALLKDSQTSAEKATYTKKEQESYIKKVKKESMYDMKVAVNSDDLLLTLMTCTRFYGADTSYSFKVDARKVRENEKQTLAKVKTNHNYKKIEEEMKVGEKNEKNA